MTTTPGKPLPRLHVVHADRATVHGSIVYSLLNRENAKATRLPDTYGSYGIPVPPQPTLFHSWHRLVLKYSPVLRITRPGPFRLLLAMMEPNSPPAPLARSQ